MKPTPKAPADKPEPSAFEKMRELTRRIIKVPKSEVPRIKSKRKRHS